jgi:hypothetical protein
MQPQELTQSVEDTALQNLQAEFPNHVYTEQEKSTIYEDVQNELIGDPM